MSEMIERVAKAMIPVFCDNGMPISSPDEGTLDDVESERWNTLVEAARAAILVLGIPEMRRVLLNLTELVEDKFPWAVEYDESNDCDAYGTLCRECESNGCIHMKIEAAREALR